MKCGVDSNLMYYNPDNATGKGKAEEKEKTMVNLFLNFFKGS